MVMAPFILCALSCASSATLGARLVPPGQAAVAVAGGVNVLLPTLDFRAVAGVAPRVDLGVQYDIHGGIAHVVALTGRVRLASPLAVSLGAAYGFFAIEEVSGIEFQRLPLGQGLTLTPAVHLSRCSRGGVHLSLGLGVTVRVVRVAERLGTPIQTDRTVRTLDREGDLAVEHAHAEFGAEWPRRSGVLFVRLRAVVPIQSDLRPLGYLPWVVIGRSWSFR
jgi:hypothetical protein